MRQIFSFLLEHFGEGGLLDRIEISDQDFNFLVGKACIGHPSARHYRFRVLQPCLQVLWTVFQGASDNTLSQTQTL